MAQSTLIPIPLLFCHPLHAESIKDSFTNELYNILDVLLGNVAAILRPWGWKPHPIVEHYSKEERSNLFLWWLPEVATFALCFLPPELFLHKKLNFFKVIICQILYNSLWMDPWMIQLCMLLYITLHMPNMSYFIHLNEK